MRVITVKNVVEKIADGDDINARDIKSIGMFNDHYINMLLEAGQEVAKRKVVEGLSRQGITKFEGGQNK